MSNQTITRDPDTIRSGSTYTSDPGVDAIVIVDRQATTSDKVNDFTHVRDVRQVVTSGLALVGTGFLAMSVILLLLQIVPFAILTAFAGVAAALAGVVIGRTRSSKQWGYQLAGYAAVGSAALAVILIAVSYVAQATGAYEIGALTAALS